MVPGGVWLCPPGAVLIFPVLLSSSVGGLCRPGRLGLVAPCGPELRALGSNFSTQTGTEEVTQDCQHRPRPGRPRQGDQVRTGSQRVEQSPVLEKTCSAGRGGESLPSHQSTGGIITTTNTLHPRHNQDSHQFKPDFARQIDLKGRRLLQHSQVR